MSVSTRAPAVGAIGEPKERAHCVFSQTPRLMNAGDRFVFFRVVSGRSCPDFVSSQRASSVRFRENKKKTGTFRKQFRASRENI